jgi:XTP/dITP diphosphohydrolase
LQALHWFENRKARFRTVISAIINGEEKLFSGTCEGHIGFEPKGLKGFGYDSIFIPVGDTRTFAEMSLEGKNRFSHRKKALAQLLQFLSKDEQNLAKKANNLDITSLGMS